jgi:hypothetical protein
MALIATSGASKESLMAIATWGRWAYSFKVDAEQTLAVFVVTVPVLCSRCTPFGYVPDVGMNTEFICYP